VASLRKLLSDRVRDARLNVCRMLPIAFALLFNTFCIYAVPRLQHFIKRKQSTLAATLPGAKSAVVQVSICLYSFPSVHVFLASHWASLNVVIYNLLLAIAAATTTLRGFSSDSRTEQQCAQASRLVAGRMLWLGVQHGCAGWYDEAHSLWPVNDRLEIHWRKASSILGTLMQHLNT